MSAPVLLLARAVVAVAGVIGIATLLDKVLEALMGGEKRITFFASGNGDTVLIEAHGKTILTDINYRTGRCQDEDDDEAPDFADDIRKACANDHLDLFVLTHPDQDHLNGFGEIFHLGAREDWDDDPDEGPVKIIVDEIWCSPYSADPHYTTDCSEPVVKEIKRRKALAGTSAANTAGNRLVIMDTDSHHSGKFVEGINWRLLAPTPEEADIPESDDPEQPSTSNPSSLVIRWTITVDGKENYVLIGGDTLVEVLERIHDDVLKPDPSSLKWHIMLAPHHCSRRSIGRVLNPNTDEETFEPSEKAEDTLSEQQGDGFVVASSNAVVKGGQSPPSWDAKQRYLKILARGETITDAERDRFLCTGAIKTGDKPAHVRFNFTASGPSKALKAAPFVSTIGTSSGRGGGYGNGRRR